MAVGNRSCGPGEQLEVTHPLPPPASRRLRDSGSCSWQGGLAPEPPAPPASRPTPLVHLPPPSTLLLRMLVLLPALPVLQGQGYSG